ncbi:MAG: ribokinase [Pseudomonadota bacterium]
MPHEIVILGVFVADAAFRAARMPVVGETLIGTGFTLGPGGKGSNQAVAAAKAGGDVGFIARLGQDPFAEMAKKVWADSGVTPLIIRDTENGTGAAGIFIEEESGKNAIVIAPGAAGAISIADVDTQADAIRAARVAVTQLEQSVDVAAHFLRLAHQAGTTTILNPAPAAPLTDEILTFCDYITPNETEAEALTGIPVNTPQDAETAARALLNRGVRKAAIITLGDQGALVHDGATTRRIPPLSAGPVVDTTGAGDAFNGGLATALAAGQDLDAALRFATATAALSVTREGTAASMPERAEIDALLRR